VAQRSDTWTRATLGSAAADGDPITVWCNNPACGYALEHGGQYRAVLTRADLVNYAEKYGGAVTFIEFASAYDAGTAAAAMSAQSSTAMPRRRGSVGNGWHALAGYPLWPVI
jgi:hypothetical protein